jgi:hypothetical protein
MKILTQKQRCIRGLVIITAAPFALYFWGGEEPTSPPTPPPVVKKETRTLPKHDSSAKPIDGPPVLTQLQK